MLKLWTNGVPGSEYFLVENRQRTGFDQYLPGDGLLIWHIDESASSNAVDCHPRVLLVAADDASNFPCNLPDRYGSSGNPWPGSLNATIVECGNAAEQQALLGRSHKRRTRVDQRFRPSMTPA